MSPLDALWAAVRALGILYGAIYGALALVIILAALRRKLKLRHAVRRASAWHPELKDRTTALTGGERRVLRRLEGDLAGRHHGR
jgi:hypothetical protein